MQHVAQHKNWQSDFLSMQVVARVQVSGKGYRHPDGRVAVAALLFDEVLEYVPQRPKERIVDVEY